MSRIINQRLIRFLSALKELKVTNHFRQIHNRSLLRINQSIIINQWHTNISNHKIRRYFRMVIQVRTNPIGISIRFWQSNAAFSWRLQITVIARIC